MLKKKLLTFTLYSLLIIIFLEIFLSLTIPIHFTGPSRAYKYDEILGVRVKENLNLVEVTDVRQEYITNKIGTFNFENTFDIYDKIIFTAGDSFTQGTGVTPTSSYPFNLFLNLNSNEKSNLKYGVLNLGLAAYGFDQSFLAIKRYNEIIKPDIVIFLGVENDNTDDELFNSGYRHNHLVDGSPRFFGFGGIVGSLANKFEILKRLKLIYSKQNRKKTLKNYENVKENKILNFQKYLELKKFTDLNEIKLYISWYQCHTLNEKKNYNDLMNWSKNNNIEFIDWCSDFIKILKINPNIPIANNHSSGHHRPWVYYLMAKNFANKIHNDK